jgi:hypothetical protein
MTHATVWIEFAAFAAVWMPVGAAGMFASARWELRDTADTSVTAAMARNNLRMSSSSELQARVCASRNFIALPCPI